MDRPQYRAYICCGPNCGPKGSGSLLDFLAEEVARQHLADRVVVLPTGCQSHCESGPTMVVYPGPVFYQEVDVERLRRIVSQHFLEGEPVKEYFWSGVRKRIVPGGAGQAATLQMPASWRDEEKGQAGKKEKPKRVVREVDDFKW